MFVPSSWFTVEYTNYHATTSFSLFSVASQSSLHFFIFYCVLDAILKWIKIAISVRQASPLWPMTRNLHLTNTFRLCAVVKSWSGGSFMLLSSFRWVGKVSGVHLWQPELIERGLWSLRNSLQTSAIKLCWDQGIDQGRHIKPFRRFWVLPGAHWPQ